MAPGPAAGAGAGAAPKAIKPWNVIEPFYKKHLAYLYSSIPHTLTPPEGWNEYKHHHRGRKYGTSHIPPAKNQLKLICRGVDFIGPLTQTPNPVRKWLKFPDELSFSRDQLTQKNELSLKKPYTYTRTVMLKTSAAQRKMMNNWINGQKFIYNSALKAVQEKRMPMHLSLLSLAFSTHRQHNKPDNMPVRKTPRPKKVVDYKEMADEKEEEEKEEAGHGSEGQECIPAQYGGGFLLGLFPKLADIPANVRVNAVRDVVKGYDSMFARMKKGGHGGELKPRTAARGNLAVLNPRLKEGYSSFRMESIPPLPNERRRKVHTDLYLGHGLGALRVRQPLPASALQHAITISRSRRGKFYISYVMQKAIRQIPALPSIEKRTMIGLDPGIRAFMTRFDAETGAHRQYGGDTGSGREYGSQKIQKLVTKSTRLVRECAQAKKDLAKHLAHTPTPPTTAAATATTAAPAPASASASFRAAQAKSKLKKLENKKWKALEKVHNVTDNLHKQVAADLTAQKGRTILLPALPVKDLVQRTNPKTGKRRKLWGKTAKAMLNLCHYKFRSFLKHKVVMTGCELIIVPEHYTSMTCGGDKCGHLNRDLGSADVFKCTAAKCLEEGHEEDQEQRGEEYFLQRCGIDHGDHALDCDYVSGRDESASRNMFPLQMNIFLSENGRQEAEMRRQEAAERSLAQELERRRTQEADTMSENKMDIDE